VERRVLIIAQNLAVPFDRRLRLESKAVVSAGYRATAVCPKGSGDPAYQIIDKLEPLLRASVEYKLSRCECPTPHHERRQARPPISAGSARNRSRLSWLPGDLSGRYALRAKRFRC
jgi:hypothetical protein